MLTRCPRLLLGVAALAIVAGPIGPVPGVAQVEAWRAQYDSPESSPETFFQFFGFPAGERTSAAGPDGSLTSVFTLLDGELGSLVTRLDADGELVWTRHLENGAFTGALELDSLLNTFVLDSTPDGCAAVTKIDPAGNVLWTTAPTPLSPCSIHLSLLAVAADGSVYAGGTLGADSMIVIGFSALGVEQWRHVRANASSQPSPQDLEVDDDGNVLMAAAFYNSTLDYLIVKLEADGDPAWDRTFDGGNGDFPRDLAVDADGRITVSGLSWADTLDYVTVRFEPDGDPLWAPIRLERTATTFGNFSVDPRVAVADDGSAYVLGSTGVEVDSKLLIVKYDASGDELWRDTLDDTGGGLQIALDDEANVYVTGVASIDDIRQMVVLAYTPSGERAWIYLGPPDPPGESILPADLAVGEDRLMVSATHLGPDFGDRQVRWVAIDLEGSFLWQSMSEALGIADSYCRHALPVEGDHIRLGSCLAVGPDGVHLGGASIEQFSPTGYELRTVKLASDGASEWTRGLSQDVEGVTEYTASTTIDASGNVYTAGAYPWVVAKYDADGMLAWSKTTENGDEARWVNVGASGAIYAGGHAFPAPDGRLLLVQYDAAGNENWQKALGGPHPDDDRLLAQVVTAEEHIIQGGTLSVEAGFDALARAYDADGDVVFTETFAATGGAAWLAALVADGNDVVGAGRARNATDFDALAVKIDSTGNVVFRTDIEGTIEEGDDEAAAVAVDLSGNAYVAGRTWNGADFEVFVVKLDPGESVGVAPSIRATATTKLGRRVRFAGGGSVPDRLDRRPRLERQRHRRAHAAP